MSDSEPYLDKACRIVRESYNKDIVPSGLPGALWVDRHQVYVVWFTKTLQNWKALVSTVNNDGLYFEVTYDGDKEKAYLDTYVKFSNEAILDEVPV